MTRNGRKKCAPAPNRAVERVYLLFDASGSMSDQLQAQALSCAQQYAKHAIDVGASVVIGNFAGQITLSEPTRDYMDVGFALRGGNDPTRTLLPGRELDRYFEQNPDLASDIVILSDGRIPNLREVMPWYSYFLELNQDNRGYMYTLGTPGPQSVTAALRQIGFEVFVYRIL